MFLGKALCGWPGLSPEGVYSPRPMSGPSLFTHSKSFQAEKRANECQGWRSGFKCWPEVL